MSKNALKFWGWSAIASPLVLILCTAGEFSETFVGLVAIWLLVTTFVSGLALIKLPKTKTKK